MCFTLRRLIESLTASFHHAPLNLATSLLSGVVAQPSRLQSSAWNIHNSSWSASKGQPVGLVLLGIGKDQVRAGVFVETP
jgi:hypothetical protein